MNGDEIAQQVEALIVTRGPKGSEIITRDDRTLVGPAKARDVKDPTGCGDAYRAGLLTALAMG